MTLVVQLLLLTYAAYKFQIVLELGEMQLISYVDGNFFMPDDHFTHREGFMFTAQVIDLKARGL